MENLDDKEKAKHAPIAVAHTSDKNGPKTAKQIIQTSDESDQETPIFSIKKSSPQRKVQKVQIVRSDGGKTQVRGLLPGQKLVQMPDGKLQLFSPPNVPQQQQQQQQSQQQPISTFGDIQTQNNAGQKQMVLVDSKVSKMYMLLKFKYYSFLKTFYLLCMFVYLLRNTIHLHL